MAKGLKTLAALGGLGAAAYLAGKMGKKDEDMDTTADASAGQAKDRLGKDESNYDELANMDRTKAARSGATKKKDTPAQAVGKALMKKDKGPLFLSGEEVANEKQRMINRSVSRGGPGEDRLGESAAGRMLQRVMNRRAASRGDDEGMDAGSGGIGENIVGAKRGGKIKAKKYAGGGSVGSASRRADGCAMRGKTKGRMV